MVRPVVRREIKNGPGPLAEWIRIHPFANGNGRIARLWVNSIAMRYDLRPRVGCASSGLLLRPDLIQHSHQIFRQPQVGDREIFPQMSDRRCAGDQQYVG